MEKQYENRQSIPSRRRPGHCLGGLVATTAASSQNPCITQWCGENNPTGVISWQGKTGIGTQSPGALLHVDRVISTGFGLPTIPGPAEPLVRFSSSTRNGSLSSSRSASATANLQLSAKASIDPITLANPGGKDVTSTASFWVTASAPSGTKQLVIDAENQDMPISFRIGGSERLRINPDGTVEIVGGGVKFPDGSIQRTATSSGPKGDKGAKGDKGEKGDKG